MVGARGGIRFERVGDGRTRAGMAHGRNLTAIRRGDLCAEGTGLFVEIPEDRRRHANVPRAVEAKDMDVLGEDEPFGELVGRAKWAGLLGRGLEVGPRVGEAEHRRAGPPWAEGSAEVMSEVFSGFAVPPGTASSAAFTAAVASAENATAAKVVVVIVMGEFLRMTASAGAGLRGFRPCPASWR